MKHDEEELTSNLLWPMEAYRWLQFFFLFRDKLPVRNDCTSTGMVPITQVSWLVRQTFLCLDSKLAMLTSPVKTWALHKNRRRLLIGFVSWHDSTVAASSRRSSGLINVYFSNLNNRRNISTLIRETTLSRRKEREMSYFTGCAVPAAETTL